VVRGKEIDLADAVRILVNLFPVQHNASSAWLKTIRSAQGEREDMLGEVARHDSTTKPASRHALDYQKDRSTPASVQRSNKRPPPQAPRPIPLPPPPPLPAFVRELRSSETEWRDKLPPGIEISWTQENAVRDRVASHAGFATWGRGYRSTMLTVKSEASWDAGRSVSVEIVIPRLQDLNAVLLVVAPRHGGERIFEMSVAELSRQHIEELGRYVLTTAGIQ
jgi:hypothetical protein